MQNLFRRHLCFPEQIEFEKSQVQPSISTPRTMPRLKGTRLVLCLYLIDGCRYFTLQISKLMLECFLSFQPHHLSLHQQHKCQTPKPRHKGYQLQERSYSSKNHWNFEKFLTVLEQVMLEATSRGASQTTDEGRVGKVERGEREPELLRVWRSKVPLQDWR